MTCAETRRRVESMTRDGLTIGQVMAEVARMGDPVGAGRGARDHGGRAAAPGDAGPRAAQARRGAVPKHETWPSMNEAARAHGVNPSAIQRACHTGSPCCGHGFRLKED